VPKHAEFFAHLLRRRGSRSKRQLKESETGTVEETGKPVRKTKCWELGGRREGGEQLNNDGDGAHSVGGHGCGHEFRVIDDHIRGDFLDLFDDRLVGGLEHGLHRAAVVE
jgi:hypothetical protein